MVQHSFGRWCSTHALPAALLATPTPRLLPAHPVPGPRPLHLQLNITCLIPPEKINYGTVVLAVEAFQPLPSSNEPVEVRSTSRPGLRGGGSCVHATRVHAQHCTAVWTPAAPAAASMGATSHDRCIMHT